MCNCLCVWIAGRAGRSKNTLKIRQTEISKVDIELHTFSLFIVDIDHRQELLTFRDLKQLYGYIKS